MSIYFFIWLIITGIISIWVVMGFPAGNVFSKYSYKKFIVNIISPSNLSSADIENKEIKATKIFFFRFRVWSLFLLGSIVLVSLYSFFTVNEQMVEIQNLVEQVENKK